MKLSVIILSYLIFLNGLSSNNKSILRDSGNMTFEFIKEKIIIPVQIGDKTYRFLLDTGGILEISAELQNEFNFELVESTSILDINRKEIEIPTVTVPELRLGNWEFKNRKAIVSDLHSQYPYSCFELDGMIGRDFFEDVWLHFDIESKTFRITEDKNGLVLNKSNRSKLKISKRGLPNVKLKLNGKKEYIEFDSGSGDFYSSKSSDVENKIAKQGAGDILAFHGIFSFGVTMEDVQTSHRYREKMKSFEIGNTVFTNFYTQFSKISAPRIGAGILKYGSVTLDYKNGWFYYTPYRREPQIESFESHGFDIANINGIWQVKYIMVGSNAERLGLIPGSQILMINDKSLENIAEDCEGYLYGYDFMNYNKLLVQFVDNSGKTKTIELSKKSFP